MEMKHILQQYKIVVLNMLKRRNFEIISERLIDINFNNMTITVTIFKYDSEIRINYEKDSHQSIPMSISRLNKISRIARKSIKQFKKDAISSAWALLNNPDSGSLADYPLSGVFHNYPYASLTLYGFDTIEVRILRDDNYTIMTVYPSYFSRISRRIRKLRKIENQRRKQKHQEQKQKLADELYTKLFEEI